MIKTLENFNNALRKKYYDPITSREIFSKLQNYQVDHATMDER
jgi:hypothetical protein